MLAADDCGLAAFPGLGRVESLRASLKEWRAVPTRYKRTATSFAGKLCLAAALDSLKP
ncbi:hypothetical protein MOX02_51510 [Methylobacterium oxalidis]|uniref:Uncharacterized protein n=1 Tax=Methylobacterium oxalidis TaxID=944322 RepID=A0A512JAY1_9HYPH|nr:hypothetical protein MOX02_51510 [Methylobacterium oxalidis]GLS66180.1 hypothetical protein GCM10007888_45620 [Methylobacterium oxalidis]